MSKKSNSSTDFERIHELEREFNTLAPDSVEAEQNINERLKLLGLKFD